MIDSAKLLYILRVMKRQKVSVFAGLMGASLLALWSAPAQAFTFTTNSTYNNNPKDDIWLQSVKLNDGTIIKDFALVNQAQIIHNDKHTGGNTGAASADRGDNAQGVKAENPSNNDIAAALGNLNLNNIIDTEDSGSFTINLEFNKALDKLFFWERGRNSDLTVQALDSTGNMIGNSITLLRANSKDAGYKIDTTEIGGAQTVGSWGVSLADLGLSGSISRIQVKAESKFSGPDFKVVGAAAQSVPEPTSLLGLALMGGMFTLSRRHQTTKRC
ncbi:PEP-CTERM putative exosortase interaction domain-containing protein [Nostoc sp. PCC 7524]|nr:PEP-CTERM putative exosortase interaction domain-containing protein [Nostoc sp. PCC 7524]